MPSRCGAFPPVDGFRLGGHAVEEAGDELGVAATAAGLARPPGLPGSRRLGIYWLPGLPRQRWNPGGMVTSALAMLVRVGGGHVTFVIAEEVKLRRGPPNVSVEP